MGPLRIPEGRFQEVYTVGAGRVTSTKLGNKELAYAKFMVSVDSDVSWVDAEGSTAIAAFPCKAGIPYPFLVSKITAATASAVVVIIHDGILNK